MGCSGTPRRRNSQRRDSHYARSRYPLPREINRPFSSPRQVQTSRTLVWRATDRREKWRITAIGVVCPMGTDRLDPDRKSDRHRGPPPFPGPSPLFGSTRLHRRGPTRTRARGRKAEGGNKGGNWTNQFTVFEIRLPQPTGPRLPDVQRVQGCAYTWGTYTGQDARECSARNAVVKPLDNTDSSLLSLRNKEPPGPRTRGRVHRKYERMERYPPRRGGRGT